MQSSHARRARNKSARNPAPQSSPSLSPAALAFDLESERTPSPLIDIAPDSEPEPEIVRDGGGVAYVERATEALGRGTSAGSASPVARSVPGDIAGPADDLFPPVQGHTRAPVFAREPSMLEAFSRTVRNYVPSSIPVPTASPTPPLLSRPLSFGNFTMGNAPSSPTKHRGSSGSSAPRYRPNSANLLDEFALESDEEDSRLSGAAGAVRYPVLEDGEEVLWARWDTLRVEPGDSRRLLVLCYPTGLQIWDCTALDAVSELLNLRGPYWDLITFAATLPSPSTMLEDVFKASRPLLGLCRRSSNETTFLLYSLSSHQVIKQQSILGLVSFQANHNFIVFSTTDPSTLHIASAHSTSILYSVPSASLVSLPQLRPTRNNANINTNNILVSPPHSEPDDSDAEQSPPEPVYAFSGRLLAFASPPPRPGSPTTDPSSLQPRAGVQSSGVLGGISQADIGNAALKVGGSVLSGMKTLGGLAYAAASRINSNTEDTTTDVSAATIRPPSFNGIFSKSAPTTSGRAHERRHSHGGGHARQHSLVDPIVSALPFSTNSTSNGYYVTVIDLQPLLTLANATRKPSHPWVPEKIAQFLVSKDQVPAMLSFSDDGTTLAVCPRDGHAVQIFQIRCTSRALKAAVGTVRGGHDAQRQAAARRALIADETSMLDLPSTGDAPWHLYNLRRGRTSAVVEGLEWAVDGRWFSMGTGKRTVHVFAINPYGGTPDEASHLEGRVRNVDQLQPLSVDISPFVRLRPSRMPTPEQRPAPLAFTFVDNSVASLPTSLLPVPQSPSNRITPSSVSPSSYGRSRPPMSPPPSTQWPRNFQDMLVFDPLDGTLFLRRFTVEQRIKEQGITVPNSLPVVGGTSISLPGYGAVGLLSRTPPSSSTLDSRGSPIGNLTSERTTELVGRGSVVATWSLRRTADWKEVKMAVRPSGTTRSPRSRPQLESVSQAELSTCSRSPRLMPRPIYLSHQFSFFAFGEDYHALLRRYQFNAPSTKIEVRKEVVASAYSAIESESFVEGGGMSIHRGRLSASFDEPLASALSSGMSLSSSSAPVLPMLPNGTPGARSYRNTIPIRHVAAGLSEGMNEGLGRLRREMGKVRSPRLQAVSNAIAGPIPLEFDEEDEHFQTLDARPDDEEGSTSRGTSRDEPSISTPSADAGDVADGGLLIGDDNWDSGWGSEEKQLIEEAETFDDISAVGFMDEDQLPMIGSTAAAASSRSKKAKKRNRTAHP